MTGPADPRAARPAPPAGVARPRGVLLRLALFILLLGGALGIVTLAWRFLALPRPRIAGVFQPVPFLAYMAVVSAVTVAVVALLLRATEGRPLAALGLRWRGRAAGEFAGGILIGALPVAVTAGLAVALGYGSIASGDAGRAGLVTTLLPFALGTVLISAWEELVWRGYLLRLFEQGAGRWPAALLTALLWSAGHLANDGATPLGLLATAASGVVLAWIVLRTGSLWIALGYHVAWNVTAIHALGFTTSGVAESASFFRTTLRGPAWVSGGAYGFEASLVTGLLDVGTLSAALLLASRARAYSDRAR